ncbi:MAG: GDP-L-fucose synthase, partial [Alphaproteobacteria bacterium]|nr:GDP-L-fucose synthase [Alphaproteobacteria bacterium]
MVAKIFDLAGRRVFVAGHRGMVGSALVRRLGIIDCHLMTASRDKLDLLDGAATHHYLADAKPDVVIVAAAKVGGIHANSTYPAEFIQE